MARRTSKSSTAPRSSRGMWFVQAIEYALGIAVGASAINSSDKLALGVCALSMVANAATVRAPLSAFRWTAPRVHRIIGVLVAVIAIALAVLADVQATTMVVLLAAGIAQGFLSVRFGHGIRATRT